MTSDGLRVGLVGCGAIGRKRSEALRADDVLVGCVDTSYEAAAQLAAEHGARVFDSLGDLLELEPDVVVVATTHDRLAPLAVQALGGGAHVLVEKPAGLGVSDVDTLVAAAARSGKLVKVGFNHRFHPAIARLAEEVHSGRHGEFLHLRARYGHGGRVGYDHEWRADPRRSGGGELIDQGMHLLDLAHWLAGPLQLHSALLRTQYWDTEVEDNAALLLGDADNRTAPWAMLHVTWTEWKNTFSLEAYCRTAKLQVEGLVRSYGTQRLLIFRMSPRLGPPDFEQLEYPDEDQSWAAEWQHFVDALHGTVDLMGSPSDARYVWERVEDAYARTPYAAMREGIVV